MYSICIDRNKNERTLGDLEENVSAEGGEEKMECEGSQKSD